MKETSLNEIYNDFYGKSEPDYKKIDEYNIDNLDEDIDSLLISDESKELINKVFDYVKKYNEGIETKYISFNIIIHSDNKELITSLVNILSSVLYKYKYIKSKDALVSSFYKITDAEDVKNLYKNANVVLLYDLKGFNLYEDNLQKRIMFNLKENLLNNNITIISGTDDEIKDFLLKDSMLKVKYFNIELYGIEPNVNDVYDDIINNISNFEINDELRIKLLDYIKETFVKREVDYITYKENLVNEISINKNIPSIEVNKSTDEIFNDLNELVGLDKVKKVLYELVDLLKFKSKIDEIKIDNINLHMVFLGNPGTGKTTVARMICGILSDLKYIKENKLIEVSSKDLVGEYVGQTAPKTMSVVEKALGGVLFIDEAYALADKGNNSYNSEAIATLIKAMEDYRDKLVVIFAGYSKEMQPFLDSNSGIVSRIGYILEFDDYTNEELKKIFISMMNKSGFNVTNEALNKLDILINENKNVKNFGNARFIRNVYEKVIIKHASNTKNIKKKSILKTITLEDINVQDI